MGYYNDKPFHERIFAQMLHDRIGNFFSMQPVKQRDYRQPYTAAFAKRHLSADAVNVLMDDEQPQTLADLAELYGARCLRPALAEIQTNVENLVHHGDPVQVLALTKAVVNHLNVVNVDADYELMFSDDVDIDKLRATITPTTRYLAIDIWRAVRQFDDKSVAIDDNAGQQFINNEVAVFDAIDGLVNICASMRWDQVWQMANTYNITSKHVTATGFLTIDKTLVNALSDIEQAWRQQVVSFFAEYGVTWHMEGDAQ